MKILCIIQARMGSERLPGKVIKPIMDKPMILYTLNRLSKSKYIDNIVLATSTEEREQLLVDVVKKAKYDVFRGHESNVLKRYKDASDKFGGDIIIRVTGDCPLIDAEIVDNVITYFKTNDYDYVRLDVPDTFVRGFDVEIFTKAALDKVDKTVNNINIDETKNTEEINMYKEHVTYYIYKHPEEFKIGYVKGSKFYNKDYRLCVDTKEDFNLVETIYNNFKNEFVSAKEVIEYLDNNSEVTKINRNIKQR
ncbi:3-deoxy-manno-octulosonate cytidylyltransferase [Clostridium sp. P21]|uniref:3-deoxy-manno-octulosonate cytidylyltransferase n=1 Tax=Clostridium muellerianum TaxID=2716538 RepID=A0A7Y0HLJ7_9CLOT|nr:glycosyltransferase family protein [Clostridium muellerianum]NMM61290.1 3-deoxy-manno-octulosonate cytidylyltransferase [Clostridium muellerianum]